MKKIVILAAAFLIGAVLFCSCSYHKIAGTYTFGEGVDSSSVTLNEDGSFEFTFSPLSSYIGFGKFTVTGDRLTLETSDGKYHYVFRITDDGIVFDAEASSDDLWMGQFIDGSLFD